MRPVFLLAILLTSGFAASAGAAADDWANPPFTVVAARVELTVGRELSMVSIRMMLQYVERDDTRHNARVFVHCPLYVDKTVTDWHDAVSAADIKLQVAGQIFTPVDGGIVSADVLSDYPVPEDAAVAFLTFEIPRSAATWRFEVQVNHIQPNFHHHGALLAAFTPWLPKVTHVQKVFEFADKDFEVVIRGLSGVTFRKYTANDEVLADTPTELKVIPVHRKTIAVEILPAAAPPAAKQN